MINKDKIIKKTNRGFLMEFIVNFASQKGEQTSLSTLKRLAQGKSEVYHVQNASVLEEYALKTFLKDGLSYKRFKRERDMISLLDHLNIIKYHPIIGHNSESDIIITEYAPHGDFFNLAIKGGLNHEVHIRTYFHQLIEGLEYMHSRRVAHLDLKLENLLLGNDFLLKIIDFDQSHLIDEEQINCTGTNGYRSPEVQNKTCKDAFAADVYSAGIILYAFKARKFPFAEVVEDGKTKIVSYDLFTNDNEEFWRIKTLQNREKADFFTADFKQLIRGMLEEDPSKRMTIQDIKDSEWFNKPILGRDGLAIRMKTVCRNLDKKSNSAATTPTTSKRSLFANIVSVLSPKSSNGRSLDTKLWGCGFPKSKRDKKKLQIETDTRNPSSISHSHKGSFDSVFFNVPTSRAGIQNTSIRGNSEETKTTTFGSSEFIETPWTEKKKKSNQLSKTDTSRSSTLPIRVTIDLAQKPAIKPAKSIWAREKDERINAARQNALPSSARRPVSAGLVEKVKSDS